MKASAQGVFMLMTNGIGASIGVWLAGKVIDTYCSWQGNYLVENVAGGWQTCWFIFAGFALVVGVLFALVFKPEKR
jgi:sugar phosphate permease